MLCNKYTNICKSDHHDIYYYTVNVILFFIFYSDFLAMFTYSFSFRNLSMIDNMVGLLETYANHLEDLVVDRTKALNIEKSKVETLLFKLLPK